MTDTAEKLDYSKTLYLPKTDFPMKAGLSTREPELLARWEAMDLWGKLRAQSLGRERFILGRTDSEEAMSWALTLGIRRFQGFFIDRVVEKKAEKMLQAKLSGRSL